MRSLVYSPARTHIFSAVLSDDVVLLAFEQALIFSATQGVKGLLGL